MKYSTIDAILHPNIGKETGIWSPSLTIAAIMCSCEFYGGPDGTFISQNVELLDGENFIEHCSLSDRLFGAVHSLSVLFHKSYLLLVQDWPV